MAQIQDHKSDFYRQKQSVKDESEAPQYLESAGDVLIKNLAKKQTQTSTTLKEQLEVVQNFEKGFELSADQRSGITSLEDFKKDITDEESCSHRPETSKEQSIEELMKITGLSRHELELSLVEKPNSEISHLYKFAIGNKKQKTSSREELPEHPINRLKEIEEECFGHLRKSPRIETREDVEEKEEEEKEDMTEKKNKKKKHRKRKKKKPVEVEKVVRKEDLHLPEEIPSVSEEAKSFVRPSLWDVKDMKKWSSSKIHGCKPPTYYTIKNGKIIKLSKDAEDGGVT